MMPINSLFRAFFVLYLGLVKLLVMVVCWFWVSMQVLCARYSDEEFFRVRCKG